jgi:hypothetical protein
MATAHQTFCIAPSGRRRFLASVPGALPQAKLFQPFGLLMSSLQPNTYVKSTPDSVTYPRRSVMGNGASKNLTLSTNVPPQVCNGD